MSLALTAIRSPPIGLDETAIVVWMAVGRSSTRPRARRPTGYAAEFAQQSEEVKFAIRALFCLLPAVCYAIGALLFTRFSLGEAEHTRIRRLLDERAEARGRPGG